MQQLMLNLRRTVASFGFFGTEIWLGIESGKREDSGTTGCCGAYQRNGLSELLKIPCESPARHGTQAGPCTCALRPLY